MKRENFITLITWLGLLIIFIGGILLALGILTMIFLTINKYLMYSPQIITLWGLVILIGGILITGIFYYIGEQYYYRK